MKARTPPDTYAQIKKEVAAEVQRQHKQLFVQAAEDLIPQAMAVFLWTMAVNYGWKKKRLQKLVEALHETDYLMDNPSLLHHRFSPIDLEKEIKEKYDIDLRAEFSIRVGEKGKQIWKDTK